MAHTIDTIKLIFIHTPKTGGTFIENKLKILAKKYNENKLMSGHYNIKHYSNVINEYTTFGVIRNPYDRLFSAYNMFIRGCWKCFEKTFKLLKNPNSFENFVINLYNLHKDSKLPWQSADKKVANGCCIVSRQFAVHIVPQFYYFTNDNNEIGIDKNNILKYESLDTEIEKFLNNNYNDNSIVCDFFKKNIISNVDIKKTYNLHEKYPQLMDMIYEIYKVDFVNFDYKK